MSFVPGRVTRDWNPPMYGRPQLTDSENSPKELERYYRAYYNREMGAALGREGDWAYTERFHVRQVMWNAALHGACRLEIRKKLVADGDAMDILDHWARCAWSGGSLERLISQRGRFC